MWAGSAAPQGPHGDVGHLLQPSSFFLLSWVLKAAPLRSCWAVGRRRGAMAACSLSALLSSPSLFLFAVLLCSGDEMYFAPGLCLVPSCLPHVLPPAPSRLSPCPWGAVWWHCPTASLHPQPRSLPRLTLPYPLGFIKTEPISLFLFINIVLLDSCLVFCFVPASSFPLSFPPFTLQPRCSDCSPLGWKQAWAWQSVGARSWAPAPWRAVGTSGASGPQGGGRPPLRHPTA